MNYLRDKYNKRSISKLKEELKRTLYHSSNNEYIVMMNDIIKKDKWTDKQKNAVITFLIKYWENIA